MRAKKRTRCAMDGFGFVVVSGWRLASFRSEAQPKFQLRGPMWARGVAASR
jgi:hypothetical protein